MEKTRLQGIKYLFLFLFLIIAFRAFFSPSGGNLDDKLQQELTGVLAKFGIQKKSGKSYTPKIFTQEVVQEESAVIDVVEKVSPAVVSIVIKTTDFDFFNGPITDQSGIGTGFIVDKAGVIVTNSHVVDSEEGSYSVVLNDGTNYEVRKIHLDRYSDLAILEIDADNLHTVELGDSDKIKVGQKAIAIGNALGQFQNTVTSGVVSGIARELTASGGFGQPNTYENAIQTDAAVNPGNSGGPLLNSAGQVMGINVATTRGADNISFAIPVNTLKPLLESFYKDGRIVKAYMGVSYTMVTKEISQLRNIPEGAFVSRIVRNSPAEKAGIQSGDVIIKLDGKDLNSSTSLGKVIQGLKVGQTVEVVVNRENKILNYKVTLEEMPAEF